MTEDEVADMAFKLAQDFYDRICEEIENVPDKEVFKQSILEEFTDMLRNI